MNAWQQSELKNICEYFRKECISGKGYYSWSNWFDQLKNAASHPTRLVYTGLDYYSIEFYAYCISGHIIAAYYKDPSHQGLPSQLRDEITKALCARYNEPYKGTTCLVQ